MKIALTLVLMLCAYLSWAAIGRVPVASEPVSTPADTVVVRGVVKDYKGLPVRGVETNAVYLSRRAKTHPLVGFTFATVVGSSQTDARGRFRMEVRRFRAENDIALELFGYTKGYGIGFQYLEDGKDAYEVILILPEEQLVEGTLRDTRGTPLADATLSVSSLRTTAANTDKSFPFSDLPASFTAWPPSIQTGPDGRFVVRGASAETELKLELDDHRAARRRWTVAVEGSGDDAALEADPPRKIEGMVVAAGSVTPITGARIVVSSLAEGKFAGVVHTVTDDKGQFALRPYYGDELRILVTANGTAYQNMDRVIPWIDGTTTQVMTLPLDHDGFERVDGTTPDGQPASTISVDHPAIPVAEHKPTDALRARLDGTLIVQGLIMPAGAEAPTLGVFAIDPNSGRWWPIARHTSGFRLSHDGNYCVITASDGGVRILAFDSEAPQLTAPNQLETLGFRVACWLPNSEGLIAYRDAPKPQHYSGEEYWQQDHETWQFGTTEDGALELPIPPLYDVWDVSKDGQWLALHWDTHAIMTGGQLFIARRDGSELRPLARKREQYYWYPRFHPDGDRLLAKHMDGREDHRGRITIRVIARDGSRESSIWVSDDYQAEIACWSPDGAHIAVAAFVNAAFSGGEKRGAVFLVDGESAHVRQVALQNTSWVSFDSIEWSALSLPPR